MFPFSFFKGDGGWVFSGLLVHYQCVADVVPSVVGTQVIPCYGRFPVFFRTWFHGFVVFAFAYFPTFIEGFSLRFE